MRFVKCSPCIKFYSMSIYWFLTILPINDTNILLLNFFNIFIFVFIIYFFKYLPSKHGMCDFSSQIIISNRHVKMIKIFRILFFH